MSIQPKPKSSVAEYLELDLASERKHEFFDGEIYAMAGASFSHGLVAGNVASGLHARLRRKPCRVVASDLRVRVSATGLYTYPDVVVVCGEPRCTTKWTGYASRLRYTGCRPEAAVSVQVSFRRA